jgi:hypothetical protein
VSGFLLRRRPVNGARKYARGRRIMHRLCDQACSCRAGILLITDGHGLKRIFNLSFCLSAITPEQAYQQLQSLTGEAKQEFYELHSDKFKSLLKKH